MLVSGWVYLIVGGVLGYGASQAGQVLRWKRGPTVARAVPGAASGLLPADILAAIQQSPVVQQDRIAGSYRGTNVRWRVTFESAFAIGPFTLRLMCQDRGQYPWVICDVRRGQYPPLEGLAAHAPFWVSGRIARIRGDEIFLKGVHLAFED